MIKTMIKTFAIGTLFAAIAAVNAPGAQVLMIAGTPSHPPGEHEHNADVLLLAKWVNTVPGMHATTYLNGEWPPDAAFESADEIFLDADGAEGHPFFQGTHAATIGQAVKRGVGLVLYHYSTDSPAMRTVLERRP